MTIDRAIEVLKLDKTCDFEGYADEQEDAIQLGIEALKRVSSLKDHRIPGWNSLLPGETE